MGAACEEAALPELKFMHLATEFVRRHQWSSDHSCGDVDVLELLEFVDGKDARALRSAVRDCIADGALHLQAVLELPYDQMKAAFFLEILEAAAKEGAPEDSAASLPQGSRAVRTFARFATACEARDAQKHYDGLLSSLGLSPGASLADLTPLLMPVLPHRSRQLLTVLSARARRTLAPARTPLRAVVIGAGPVGLRTAIELATVGVDVEVLEARDRFSRLQVLHLWDWVEADLIDLGVKLLDPSIFAAADLRRCQTCAMQISLLKVALLMGVRVRFGVRVDRLIDLAKVHPGAVDMLVDASGARCGLLASLGFTQTLALKSQRALCVVLSLVNTGSAPELELRESTWSAQYYQGHFAQLHEQSGVLLENFVYYRSTGAFTASATHYFLMTTELAALHAYGALIDASVADADGAALDPCRASNVRIAALEQYAREAIGAFVPMVAQQPMVAGQLSLFDFSERYHSNTAAAIVPGHGWAPGARRRVLVTRVGDALQEPFWPEGLGINRGFFHAFDTADMARHFAAIVARANDVVRARAGASSAEEVEEACRLLLARREELFNLTKLLSSVTRTQELRAFVDGAQSFTYTPSPASRYTSWSAQREAKSLERGADGSNGVFEV